jgi:hypothetical protein
MKNSLAGLILLITSTANAFEITSDHFQWTNYDNGIHLLAGYSISLTTSLLLEKQFKMKPVPALIIGVLVGGFIGTVKETFFDVYASQTDLKTWWAGSISGGLTFTVIHF